MHYREYVHELKSAGFWLKRRGKRHEIWTNGQVDQAITPGSCRSAGSWRTQKSFLVKMRKAREALSAEKV
jgi:hypothetical protein